MDQLNSQEASMARIYDWFNDQSSYYDWLAFCQDYLANESAKVLDMACGTGVFTSLLASQGHQVLGIDLDPVMIQLAKERQADLDMDTLDFREGDLLDLSVLDTDYQLVTCFADSLCFLADYESLKVAFREIYRRLASAGVFLFDVWTPYQVSSGFEGFSYHDYDDEGAILWDTEVDPDSLQVNHYLRIFERTSHESGQELFTANDLVLEERTYSLEKYLTALEEAGFSREKIQVRVDFGQEIYDDHMHTQADRWFFVCHK